MTISITMRQKNCSLAKFFEAFTIDAGRVKCHLRIRLPELFTRISVQYTFVKDYAVILIIFLIPFIYIAGHIVNTIDFIMMKYYVWLHPLLKTSKWWRWFLKINEFLFYRHRIVFQGGHILERKCGPEGIFHNGRILDIVCEVTEAQKL